MESDKPYAFRPLDAEDLPLVGRWLRQPHVARWWGDPDEELSKIAAHIGAGGVTAYLVALADGRALGFLQCYDPARDPDETLPPQPPGTRGIDFFIGDPDLVGRGHGTGMIRQFTDGLLAGADVTRVIADPDPANMRSIAALAGAGFKPAGEVELPWGPACLMEKATTLDPAVRAALRETAGKVLASLSRREQRLLRERFGLGGGSPPEVGRQFAVTRERIRRIEARAMRKLKRARDPDASGEPSGPPPPGRRDGTREPPPSADPANDNEAGPD